MTYIKLTSYYEVRKPNRWQAKIIPLSKSEKKQVLAESSANYRSLNFAARWCTSVFLLSYHGEWLCYQVVKTVGLREIWYFGLSFVDNADLSAWLSMDKKVTLTNAYLDDG